MLHISPNSVVSPHAMMTGFDPSSCAESFAKENKMTIGNSTLATLRNRSHNFTDSMTKFLGDEQHAEVCWAI
jgi:hypothetical protein